MKTLSLTLKFAVCVVFVFAALGCSSSPATESPTSAANASSSDETADLENLVKKVTQIPGKTVPKPYKPYGGYIYQLERREGGDFKFSIDPKHASATYTLPAANTMFVALIDYKKVPDGQYKVEDTGELVPAFRRDAEITVIDHSVPAVVVKKVIKGQTMRERMNSDKTVVRDHQTEIIGPEPLDEIREFFKSIPERDK